MAKGGFRPGSGRPKGAKDKRPRKNAIKIKKSKKPVEPSMKDRIKELLKASVAAKAKAYHDLAVKQQQGEPLSTAELKTMMSLERDLQDAVNDENDESDAENKKISPLEYMLKIMRDPNKDEDIRKQCAFEAAKYCHIRIDTTKGKKDEAEERATKASAGKYAPAAPPLKRVK